MMQDNELQALQTEKSNKSTKEIDTWDTEQILHGINRLDQEVPLKVAAVIPQITQAVEYMLERYLKGGRIVYVGAGTSGRIGIMDAAECPPTYGIPNDRISAMVAGGNGSLVKANEGAEDSSEQAIIDLKNYHLLEQDVVVAISSSGRTPYCVGALTYAAEVGAGTISLACNKNAVISRYAEVSIEVDSGPEAIMGSTRMKGGTSQKLILNMLSTALMVRAGNVYENLMVNLQGTNYKLENRVRQIFEIATDIHDQEKIETILTSSNFNLKTAITMALGQISAEQAEQLLEEHEGSVRKAINHLGM